MCNMYGSTSKGHCRKFVASRKSRVFNCRGPRIASATLGDYVDYNEIYTTTVPDNDYYVYDGGVDYDYGSRYDYLYLRNDYDYGDYGYN